MSMGRHNQISANKIDVYIKRTMSISLKLYVYHFDPELNVDMESTWLSEHSDELLPNLSKC